MWEVNGNYWSKDKYSYDEAVELSKTLVNCDNCLDCKDCYGCLDCVFCKYCIYLILNKKIDGRENDE